MTDNPEKESVEQRAARIRQADLRLRESSVQTRQESVNNGFDLRTEVSADARYIVKHLWIIFVLLPVVFAILYEILSRMER